MERDDLDEPKNEDGSRTPAREDEDGTPSVDEILGTLFSESTLWPLLIVLLGSSGAFGGAMLVLAFGDHNPFAAAALLLLLGMSVDLAMRARRLPGLRRAAWLVAAFWCSSVTLAGIAVWSGIT